MGEEYDVKYCVQVYKYCVEIWNTLETDSFVMSIWVSIYHNLQVVLFVYLRFEPSSECLH